MKAHERDCVTALEVEKARRVYYQHIVYEVCNTLDGLLGRRTSVVCGTVENPSTGVQDALKTLRERYAPAMAACRRIKEYRDLPLGSILELEAIQKLLDLIAE